MQQQQQQQELEDDKDWFGPGVPQLRYEYELMNDEEVGGPAISQNQLLSSSLLLQQADSCALITPTITQQGT